MTFSFASSFAAMSTEATHCRRPDRDRAAAERDSLPLISGSPVFPTAACHSVSTSRVAEQIKSHL
ncbi:hypothetical protein EYF80_028086 [Liparis tanakae]|uniref:Uncharacterized protein n=1 Tax=Liparis tanakae TaxID=230148 RepID=A0A4Z2HA17_9TELE|nr:hypothetical protein EYF80_028086 [Liparis tanakae]